jgi:hypothetical protein
MEVLQVVHIQYMSTFVLQLRMSLDIFHSITNISLLIACLLHVNYWSHARHVDCGKFLFSITMLTLKNSLKPASQSNNFTGKMLSFLIKNWGYLRIFVLTWTPLLLHTTNDNQLMIINQSIDEKK